MYDIACQSGSIRIVKFVNSISEGTYPKIIFSILKNRLYIQESKTLIASCFFQVVGIIALKGKQI